jgi:hypothetical protein
VCSRRPSAFGRLGYFLDHSVSRSAALAPYEQSSSRILFESMDLGSSCTMRSSGPRGQAMVFPDALSARFRLTRR